MPASQAEAASQLGGRGCNSCLLLWEGVENSPVLIQRFSKDGTPVAHAGEMSQMASDIDIK